MKAISRRTATHGWDLQVVNGGSAAGGDAATPRTDSVTDVPRLFLTSTFAPAKLPETLVFRTRLLDMVTHGVRERAITLISAPAGTGKSVLAATWRAHGAVTWPVAWLTVEDDSDRPSSFWCYVVQAMKQAGVPLERLDQALPLADIDVSVMTRLATDLLDLPEPLVLVVDRFERIENSAALDVIDFLLRHAYPKFRLVLCGRGNPRLPIHRYRLSDMMAEIGSEALAFTAADSQELLAGHGLTMSARMAEDLVQHTRGWAAGLRLAVMSLRQSDDQENSRTPVCTEVSRDRFVAALSRGDRNSAEYLRFEVLETLSTELRDCLVRTSVSDQLWPGLVNELTGAGDGDRILRDLARAGLFVELPLHSAGSYRVDPMFGEMLRAQLRYETPAEVAGLHEVCMRWFAARRQYLPAARHAAAAERWDKAAEMIIEDLLVASLIDPLDPTGCSNLLMSMPVDADGASAAVVQAALAVGRGDLDIAADRLRVARQLVDPGRAPVELMLSAALVELALCAGAGAEFDGSDAAAEARRLLDRLPADRRSAHPELDALLETSRGLALLGSGAVGAAIDAFEAVLDGLEWPSVETAGTVHLQLRCLNLSAIVHATQGSLRRAKDLSHAALRLADSLGAGADSRALGAQLALAWVYVDQCEPKTAARWAAQAQDSLDRNAEPLLAPMLALVQIRLLRSRGQRAKALLLLDRSRSGTQNSAPWVRHCIALEAAEVQLAVTRPDGARNTLNTVAAGAVRVPGTGLTPRLRVDAWLAEARAHLTRGDEHSAASSVQHALQVAEPEQLRRPFVESAPQIRRLIRVGLRRDSTVLGWLNLEPVGPESVVPPHVSRTAASTSATPIEALTERETEVLRNLAQLLSTEEIAATMFISVNTVRSHVRSILRKLAVPRRNVAVRRARELQLM